MIYTGLSSDKNAVLPDHLVDSVDCGPGDDTVLYETGTDRIADNCEEKIPY